MILIDRWIEISEYLQYNKFATMEEMMDKFEISRSTLRRDLIAMEEKGLLKRLRGGAEIVEKDNARLHYNIESVFTTNKQEKMQIAKKAAEFIEDNDVVFIDSGSTCYYIIDYIQAKNVTVVTNGIVHIQKLMDKGINTYILGGYAKPEQNLIIGEDMVNKINLMNFDKAFLGTMGIDKKSGFTTEVLTDGEVKRTVIKSSEKCYVLADKSKFNLRRFYTYGGLKDATIITIDSVEFFEENAKIVYV